MRQNCFKQKQTANTDTANNFMRQQNTSVSMPNSGKRTLNKET